MLRSISTLLAFPSGILCPLSEIEIARNPKIYGWDEPLFFIGVFIWKREQRRNYFFRGCISTERQPRTRDDSCFEIYRLNRIFQDVQGDYASLLSAFTELGLKLRLDMPEEAMEVTNFFFRRSIPAKESLVSICSFLNLSGTAVSPYR